MATAKTRMYKRRQLPWCKNDLTCDKASQPMAFPEIKGKVSIVHQASGKGWYRHETVGWMACCDWLLCCGVLPGIANLMKCQFTHDICRKDTHCVPTQSSLVIRHHVFSSLQAACVSGSGWWGSEKGCVRRSTSKGRIKDGKCRPPAHRQARSLGFQRHL